MTANTQARSAYAILTAPAKIRGMIYPAGTPFRYTYPSTTDGLYHLRFRTSAGVESVRYDLAQLQYQVCPEGQEG